MIFSYYSVLNALTGSIFAADLEGIKPEIKVKPTLIITMIIACNGLVNKIKEGK